MLVLTNVIVEKVIRAGLDIVKKDYDDKKLANIENKCLLYILFKNNTFRHLDFYKESVAVFSRSKDHIKYINTSLSFAQERQTFPTVYVTQSQDSEASQGIGGNVNAMGPIEFADDTHSDTNVRIYNTSFNITIVSDNSFEAILIYEMVRALLVLLEESISSCGIMNMSISGTDITLNSNLIPQGVYIKSLILRGQYTLEIPHPSILSDAALDIIRDWRVHLAISTDEEDYQQ